MQVSTVNEIANDLRVCLSCKQRKRKCDKSYPKCSLCKRKGWDCSYPRSGSRTVRASRNSHQNLSNPVEIGPLNLGPEAALANAFDGLPSHEAGQTSFPAVFFLDPEVFQNGQLDIPRADLSIPSDVLSLLGQPAKIKAVSAQYFATIHRWMPIISKKRFYEHLVPFSSQRRADTVLLCLCMDLITRSPPSSLKNPKTPLYLTAKRFHLHAEISNIFTVQVLQAGILISLYELGHAIYPSAYLSIGACARPLTWVEVEERMRVWWAILILDRFVNLSTPSRMLATEDPKSDDLLPADDAAWDEGEISSVGLYTLSSPSTLEMGRFARLAQAVYLLGRVFKHDSDRISNKNFYDQETMQLRRTLRALISLTEVEGQIRQLEFCTQTAICYCALLLLEPDAPAAGARYTVHIDGQRVMTIREEVSKATVDIWTIFLSRFSIPLERISPLMLPSIYQATAIYTKRNRNTDDEESSNALEVLKKTLSIIDQKWKAAGAYLEILEVKEVTAFA